MMDISQYLQRIDYSGSLNPDGETLRALHRAHMLAVPFENLSIHSGERIQLNYEWLFDKIVTRRRGGFCYELNGLFGWLLTELGFRVDSLSARVARTEGNSVQAGGYGPEFDHIALLVHLEEPWLADVGFGESFLEPLRLNERGEQSDPAGKFRIVELEGGLGLQEWVKGEFETQHLFTLTPRALSDFEDMCHFHQTSPDTLFTQKVVYTQAKLDGRLTISGNKLISTLNGVRTTSEFPSAKTVTDALKLLVGFDENANSMTKSLTHL